MQYAKRINQIKPYFFANLREKINTLRAQGVDVIRMDMGSPDLPPAAHILEALKCRVDDPGVHGYTPYGGT